MEINTASPQQVNYLVGRSAGKRPKATSGLSWLLPAVLIVLAVNIYPTFYAIYLSFFETNYLQVGQFVGLNHYMQLFSGEGLHSVVRSLFFVCVCVILSVIIGGLFAWLLNLNIPHRGLLRALAVMPWVIAEITAAILWSWLLNSNLGVSRYMLESMGFGTIDFLADPILAMVMLIFVSVWRFYAFPMIIILASLQTIPDEIYEAGLVDGTTKVQAIRHITLPLIRNGVMIAVILSSLFYFNKIVTPLILTGGGPGNATNLLPLMLFREAFSNWRIGYASAISVFIFLANLAVSLLYFRILKSES